MRYLKSLGFLSLWLGCQFFYLPTKAETRLTPSNLQPERVKNELLCPQNIASEIESIINSPQLARSNWGILVKNLDSQTTIYSLNAHKYFIPASNVKLLITAAALLELGNNFRIHTPIYSVGNAPHLTQVLVQGKGDPTISTETLKKIVEQLKQKGIKHIEQLIVDNSYFNQPTINPTWEWLDVYNSYATSASSLILNNNAVTLTLLPQELGQPVKLRWSDDIAAKQWQVKNNVITAAKDTPYNVEIEGILGQPILHLNGTLAINHQSDVWDLAIVDPANYFLESLRHLLSLEGITITRGLVSNEVSLEPSAIELATIISPPLPEILAEINQESNNLYAETLLKILANQLNINDVSQAIEQVLSKLGIDPQGYNLVDGSGLSRHNLITPETLVQTLSLMTSTSVGENYLNSLTTAGVNGTLERRFINNNFPGDILGKTGTLSGINSLSGYLNVSEGKSLVFSIIVNNSDLSSKNLRQAIDRIVLLFSRVKQC
ncbi:MAG: D-alanyl-D-alanine carboxypeptidase/D-alanyl-D-alanine-endopeptidase [Xenococcaceae cyanobacterium]